MSEKRKLESDYNSHIKKVIIEPEPPKLVRQREMNAPTMNFPTMNAPKK